MSGVAPDLPKFQFSSSLGIPLVSGTLTVYLAGTTTLTDTWQDRDLTTLNENPITLNSRGECNVYLDPSISYKFTLKNVLGVTQWVIDNVSGASSTADLLALFSASGGAALVGFIQSGTGAVARTAQDEMRDRINVKHFGALGDGVTNDATNIGKAITFAALTSRVVYFPAATYVIASTLSVPAGVALVGEGRGSIVNTTPTTGAILKYTGTGSAVSLNGTLAGMERMSIVGTVSALGAGVLVNGDAVAVESWYLRQVTIYGFTGGTGLKLQGINAGAVAYGNVYDLRIRHAKTGLWIVDVGGGAGFANTNQFYGGAINGIGFDYAIRVQGGNDNRFIGMSVEPPSSTVGHIVVETGWINFDGRLEGTTQAATVPIIDIQNGTDSSSTIITGLGGAGLVKNAAGARIEMVNGKHAAPPQQTANVFNNPGLQSVDATARTIEGWTVTETGGASTWTVSAAEVVPGHNVIQIVVAASASVEIKPTSGTLPTRPTTTTPATFGVWIKTSTAQRGYARINGAGGVTTSALHSGSGSWEPVSMAQGISTGATPDPRFVLDGGAGGTTYSITAPFFAYGILQPQERHPLGQEGGTLYGTLEGGTCTVSIPAAGSDSTYTAANAELTVPKWGNLIHVTGTARTVTRLNNVSGTRMAKGTVLRLVFDIAGVVVTNGAPGFIDLTAAFTSAAVATSADRSWLLLESNGDGTWYELSRR